MSLLLGSLLVSCLLGVALTILIIVTVFYLRRHFNLTQFYPNHVKLFSKQQLNPSPLKSAIDEKSRRPGEKFLLYNILIIEPDFLLINASCSFMNKQ